jgi:hypothetical protein
MPKVKDSARSAAKWAEKSAAATGDYEAGVANPKADWKQATAAASENYKQGVTKAAAENRFQNGVNKAGTEKWQRGAQQKGARRFAEGVAVAQPDYEEGFAPYRDVIERTTLPPRKPKGDPSNIQRVSAMAAALSAAKRGVRGK